MVLSLMFFLGVSFIFSFLMKILSKDIENVLAKIIMPIGFLYIIIINIGGGFYIYQLFKYIWLIVNR
jgi:hypothetical protein